MKNILLIFATLGFVSAAQSRLADITVTSPAFQTGGKIPDKFTCQGANQNPPLQFVGIPPEAKSLVLIVEDPDAPGGLFSHWLVRNNDPATTQIAEKSVPPGASQGQNDFGNSSMAAPARPPAPIAISFVSSCLIERWISRLARNVRPWTKPWPATSSAAVN